MYYFAYGTNLNKKQMRSRLPQSQPLRQANLPNYKLVFTGWSRQWRGGSATIKLSRGDRVAGAVYEIAEKDLGRLDSYEGRDYNRMNVTVFSDDGDAIPVFTYIKAGRLDETHPSKEYLSVIQQGYKDWGII